MIEHIGRVNMDYMVRLANDPKWASEQLKRLDDFNATHGVVYGGKTIPVPIKPHFISPRQRRVMEVSLRRIMSALDKFVAHWLQNEELQEMWGVTDEEMALYRGDPGYDQPIQIARLDAFLHDYKLKFLEFNCDSPGGTGYADMIHRGFLEMFAQNDMGRDWVVSNRRRQLHLAEALSACYADWRGRGHLDRPENPYIIVSDWRDVGSLPDIDITIGHLREEGYDVDFADPRDLELKGGELWFQGKRVDVVYKRVIVKELVHEPAAQALAEAYKAGTVCMVNSPRSVIVGNKKILAALRRPDVLAIMNPEERQVIRDTVPWTEVLRDDTAEFRDFVIELKPFVQNNKDRLVLKAAQSYGGKDVFLGFETDATTWHSLIEEHIRDNAWIVQELVDIPKELFPEVGAEQVNMRLMNVNINPLAFGGRYSGCYTRISEKNVINVSFGGGMVPTMTLEPREE